MITDGIMAAKVTMPAALEDPVSLRAKAARATMSAHAEDWEKAVAIQRRRYSECWRGPSNREAKVSFLNKVFGRPDA